MKTGRQKLLINLQLVTSQLQVIKKKRGVANEEEEQGGAIMESKP